MAWPSINRRIYARLPLLLLVFVALSLLICLLVAGTYFAEFHGSLSSDQAAWGLFGDFMGGTLNPILSLLGLLALLLTIFLQSEEIRLSRQELGLSRNELKRSAEAQEQSQRALNEQVRLAQQNARVESINTVLQAEVGILQRLGHPRTVRERRRRKEILRLLSRHEEQLPALALELEALSSEEDHP